MKHKRTVLFLDYSVPTATDEQKEICVQTVIREAGGVARGESLFQQVKTQLSYVGPWFFLGMVGVLFTMLLVLYAIRSQPDMTGNTSLHVLTLFGMAGPSVACLSAPVLVRSHANGMWELEEAAVHNLSRLTAIRLLICALAASPVLVALAAAGLEATGVLQGLTALLAPFFLTGGIHYLLLGWLRDMAGSLCCIGVNAILAVLLLTLPLGTEQMAAYLQSNTAALLSALAIGGSALFFLLSARRYIFQSSMTNRKEPIYGNDF